MKTELAENRVLADLLRRMFGGCYLDDEEAEEITRWASRLTDAGTNLAELVAGALACAFPERALESGGAFTKHLADLIDRPTCEMPGSRCSRCGRRLSVAEFGEGEDAGGRMTGHVVRPRFCPSCGAEVLEWSDLGEGGGDGR